MEFLFFSQTNTGASVGMLSTDQSQSRLLEKKNQAIRKALVSARRMILLDLKRNASF